MWNLRSGAVSARQMQSVREEGSVSPRLRNQALLAVEVGGRIADRAAGPRIHTDVSGGSAFERRAARSLLHPFSAAPPGIDRVGLPAELSILPFRHVDAIDRALERLGSGGPRPHAQRQREVRTGHDRQASQTAISGRRTPRPRFPLSRPAFHPSGVIKEAGTLPMSAGARARSRDALRHSRRRVRPSTADCGFNEDELTQGPVAEFSARPASRYRSPPLSLIPCTSAVKS